MPCPNGPVAVGEVPLGAIFQPVPKEGEERTAEERKLILRVNSDYRDDLFGVELGTGHAWFATPTTRVRLMPDFYRQMMGLYYKTGRFPAKHPPEEWAKVIGEELSKLDILRTAMRCLGTDLQGFIPRLYEIVEAVGSDRLNGVRCTAPDTAHIGPWTTVRACVDCGVLITGGPTRCKFCATRME